MTSVKNTECDMKVAWSKPDFQQEELDAANESLKNYIGGNGPNVEKLEKSLLNQLAANMLWL